MSTGCGCGEGHDRHMCQLVEKKTCIEELKNIVKGAQYICQNCGRAAAKKENLCAPQEL